MELSVLSSGSKGNCSIVRNNGESFLIDAGISGKQLQERLDAVGADPRDLAGLIITHDHGDHVKCAGIYGRKFKFPIYIHEANYKNRQSLMENCDIRLITGAFQIGGFQIEPFEVSHDGSANFAYSVACQGKKLCHVTDLGMVSTLVAQFAADCDLLVLESNHDPEMLRNGSYPWELKQRVAGRHGHLSNMDACRLVAKLPKERLQHLVLAHLSEENNDPALAEEMMLKTRAFNKLNFQLHMGKQERALEFLLV